MVKLSNEKPDCLEGQTHIWVFPPGLVLLRFLGLNQKEVFMTQAKLA